MGVELNLNTGYRFNWVTSIFYIVYMFVEGKYLPSHDTSTLLTNSSPIEHPPEEDRSQVLPAPARRRLWPRLALHGVREELLRPPSRASHPRCLRGRCHAVSASPLLNLH